MLHIYNSLTNQKERFHPLSPPKVSMYVCGMTVYDLCHLGHARVLVVFDMVKKWLEQVGYSVSYVRNITDIDDKIISRALERDVDYGELTKRYIKEMHMDCAMLGVEKPDHEPLATNYVTDMVKLIENLIKKGAAYPVDSGDVYFSVRSFQEYGKLSGKTLSDLKAGKRVEINREKIFPFDFVLWKSAKKGEPSWNSPWGKGRPGWHTECSAMCKALLGDRLDIHGGGQDLQFPHHENEIAQSESVSGKKFVNYWMHNGFVNVNDEKMSKSLNNFYTVRDLREKYHPEVIRYFILRSHYRSPLNYSISHLEDAKQSLQKLYSALRIRSKRASIDWDCHYARKFRDMMNDDFNTAGAISLMFEIAAEINKTRSNKLVNQLSAMGEMLGLLDLEPVEFFQNIDGSEGLDASEIEELIKTRDLARSNKDFLTADQIRDSLSERGIELEDQPDGTTWRRK